MMAAVERARPEDRAPIEALLRASGLPLDGLEMALPLAVVAREEDRVVGVAAVEPYGQVGLASLSKPPRRSPVDAG